MVHLFRGGRGRGFPRPPMPVLMPRHMRPSGYESDFLPPFALPRRRPNLLNRPPIRPGPLPPPRMLPPQLPPRPRLPPPNLPLREMPFPHPIHPPSLRGLGIPPRIPPGPPMGRFMRPQLPLRGRGGFIKRGATVKRLVSANGRTKRPQKRKEKTEAFFCETCDRGWSTEAKLQEHVAQHKVCGRDGCTFTAHPKVVLKHTELQHDSGLYHRIAADADKWIAERKSRFPTKENIEMKMAQMNEMMKRGERIPNKENRFQRKPNNNNWRDKRQRRNKNFIKSEADGRPEKCQPIKRNKPCDRSKWRDPDAWRGELPQFPGTAAFALKDSEPNEDSPKEVHFSDDEEWAESKGIENNVKEQPVVSNVLASLMAAYGSDISDEDDDSVIPKLEVQTPVFLAEDKPVNQDLFPSNQEKECPTKVENNEEKHCDSDSGPEECAIPHEDKSNIPILDRQESKKQDVLECEANLNGNELKENEKQDIYKHVRLQLPMKRLQLSLLENFLKNEIRHERNVILQCVRYVVKNSFLGSGNLPKYNDVMRR